MLARSLVAVREIEELLAKSPHGKKWFEMRDNLRKTRKMLKTLDRKHRFTASSLFVKHADQKLLDKMAGAQLKLTKDIQKLIAKATEGMARFQASIQDLVNKARAEKLAKQKE
jgi:hypothetical protein